MRVLNYLELEGKLTRSGIGTATKNQRNALNLTDIDVVSDPWNSKNNIALNSSNIDVVHCNLFGPGSLAVSQFAKNRNIPLILHAHVTAEDFSDSFRGSNNLAPLLKKYLRWFYSLADYVLCPSNYTKTILDTYPIKSPIKAISNGIDASSLTGFESLRHNYRDMYNLSGPAIFSVGNVFERKGLTTFCELAKQTDHNFIWFGPYAKGPYASKVVRGWTQNPPENLTFTDWIEDKRGAYAAGDIFCFPSKVENQGLSVLEAMACGKAVILSDIPVFQEYYTHGKDCLMCHSVGEFKQSVDLLCEDSTLRDKLGKNAQKTAQKHDLNSLSHNLEDIYTSILNSF